MTVTTRQITGYVYTPAGEVPKRGTVIFTLANWDKEGTDIVAGGVQVATLSAAGYLDYDLWASDEGGQDYSYTVVLRYWSEGERRYLEYALGSIFVTAGGSAADLATLLAQAPVEPATPDVLAQAAAYASDASDDAARAEAAAVNAAVGTPYGFETVALLEADTTMGYSAGATEQVTAGQYILAGGFRYQVAASAATDHHLTTAGGVKLYVVPEDNVFNVQAIGCKAQASYDNTALILKAAEYMAGIADQYELYFPAAALPYEVTDLQFTTTHKNPVLSGAGYYASRIKAIKSTANYGVDFNNTDNSHGGLNRIRIETASAYTAVVRVANPNNNFSVDAVIGGNSAASGALEVDGGSAFFSPYLYTTGVTDRNIVIKNGGTAGRFIFLSGNHDVGTNGFAKITSSSACEVAFFEQRYEGCTSKDLVDVNTTNASDITMTGRLITGAAASVIYKSGGSGPRINLALTSQTAPTNWFEDAVTASNTVAAQTGFGVYRGYDHYEYKNILMQTNSSGLGGFLKFQRSGGNQFEIWPDASELNCRDATLGSYLWVAGSRGVRLGDYRQPDTGKEGLQVSGGYGVNIDGGGWNNGHLRLGNYRIWVDSTGDLRIKSGAPASDTDGTIVGTQS